MSQQSNKVQKRSRRKAYLKRQNETLKTKTKKAPAKK